MTIGTAIRLLRHARGLTQTEVAEAASLSQASMNKWEAGSHVIRRSSIRLVAPALGVSVDLLTAIQQGRQPKTAGDRLTVAKLNNIDRALTELATHLAKEPQP